MVDLDQLWMPECVRRGWCISFSPSPLEQGVWKRRRWSCRLGDQIQNQLGGHASRTTAQQEPSHRADPRYKVTLL